MIVDYLPPKATNLSLLGEQPSIRGFLVGCPLPRIQLSQAVVLDDTWLRWDERKGTCVRLYFENGTSGSEPRGRPDTVAYTAPSTGDPSIVRLRTEACSTHEMGRLVWIGCGREGDKRSSGLVAWPGERE